MTPEHKRVIAAFAPWIVAGACISALAASQQQRLVQITAFIAIFTSILLFAFSYRAVSAGHHPTPKFGVRVAAWVTILAGLAYLIVVCGH